MVNDTTAADDLLQESYLRLLKARLPRDASDEHLKNYLFRIATNLVKDRRTAWREMAIEADIAAAKTAPFDGDVRRLMAALKPKQRDLLWLAYVECFSHKEIAAMLKLRPHSIRPLLSRARRAFAEVLKRGGFGEVK
jgi:RNA polymerase sigma-70 factor (ECF subfamily)